MQVLSAPLSPDNPGKSRGQFRSAVEMSSVNIGSSQFTARSYDGGDATGDGELFIQGINASACFCVSAGSHTWRDVRGSCQV